MPRPPRAGLLLQHKALGARRAAVRRGGWRAAHVDSEPPAEARRAAVAALGRGDLDAITNCYSFTEGVEVPVLGAVLLLRPTQQGVAAGAGRERALILDHAGNVWRHGRDVTRHWCRRSSAFVYSAGKWAASRIAM